MADSDRCDEEPQTSTIKYSRCHHRYASESYHCLYELCIILDDYMDDLEARSEFRDRPVTIVDANGEQHTLRLRHHEANIIFIILYPSKTLSKISTALSLESIKTLLYNTVSISSYQF
jgi:hypothetical protein